MISERPVRNCSKFSQCQITGAASGSYAGVALAFGVTQLGRRPWHLKNIEYQASVMLDTLASGLGSLDDWSSFNGSVIVIRPANYSFLYDMFAGICNFAYASNQYNPTPSTTFSFSSAADLQALALKSVSPDIDTGRRFNRFSSEIMQPGLIDSFFSPPVLHALSFYRSCVFTQNLPSNFPAGTNEYTNCNAEFLVPGGYDVLLTYVCPGGYQGAYITTNISLNSNIRFTLEEV